MLSSDRYPALGNLTSSVFSFVIGIIPGDISLRSVTAKLISLFEGSISRVQILCIIEPAQDSIVAPSFLEVRFRMPMLWMIGSHGICVIRVRFWQAAERSSGDFGIRSICMTDIHIRKRFPQGSDDLPAHNVHERRVPECLCYGL